MITLALSIAALCILIAEFWTGFAVIGWAGDSAVIDRRKSPGPYWFVMSIHTAIGVGVSLLSAIAPSPF